MPSFCPVCRTEVPDYYYDHPHGARIRCPVCSTYRLTERAAQRLMEMRISGGLGDQPHTRLSAALRERAERGEEPVLADPEAMLREYKAAADLLEVIDRILNHIRSKEPGGSRYVPLVGHRDYGIAGAEDREAFDHALGQAVSLGYIERKAPDESAYRLTPAGFNYLRAQRIEPKRITRIFLSHSALDKELALYVQQELQKSRPGLKVFAASRPGDIRADQDWLPVIQQEMRAADAYCVLLTPNSNDRPWVWFETGAAWMSEKKWLIARIRLSQDAVPLPLSIRQSYSLDDAEGAREVFRAVDVELADPAQFAATISRLAKEAIRAKLRADGWEGMEHNGTYYTWGGPHERLGDREPEAEPPGLIDALRTEGREPRWARRDRLSTHLAKGYRQVFATDRSTYRRAINQGADLVLVAR